MHHLLYLQYNNLLCMILYRSMKRLLDLDINWWNDVPTEVFDDDIDHEILSPYEYIDDDPKPLAVRSRM